MNQRLCFLITILLCLLLNSASYAQAIQEEAKLRDYEQQLTQLQTLKQQLQQKLTSKEQELAPLKNIDSPEQKKIDLAKAELANAIADQATAPAEKSMAKIKNAQFKLALAERKFKKSNSKLYSLQQETGEISEELDNTNTEIDQLTNTINQQRIIVSDALSAQLTSSKQKQKQQANAAAAEIAELKTQLAAKEEEAKRNREALEIARKTVKAAEPITQAVTNEDIQPITDTTVNAQPKSPTRTQEPQTDNKTTSSVNTEIALKSAKTASSSGSKAILLTSAESVATEQTNLASRLAIESNSRKKGYNRILNVKPVSATSTNTRTEAFTLRSLGNDQYQGIAELSPGDNIFIVGFNRWRQIVPTNPQNNRYIIILDASDSRNPRLVYFNESFSNN